MKTKLSLVLAALLTACGGGGSSSTPSTPAAPAPVIQISSSTTKVFKGDDVKISWSTVNTTNCTGQDSLPNAAQPVNGSYNANLAKSGAIKFTLTCTGAGGQSTSAVVLDVQEPIQTFSGAQSASQITNVNPDGNYVTTKGIFAFNTGVWGQKSASSFAFDMFGTVDVKSSVLSKVQFNWEAVSSATPGVVAFNNVHVGKRPGSSTTTTDKFPMQIGNMPNVMVSGNISSVCVTTCVYGTIINLFVMNNAQQSINEIGTEIIIGVEGSNGYGPDLFTPGYAGETIIDGIQFKVYRNPTTDWKTILYFPKTPFTNVSLNIKNIITDSISRGYLASTAYLQGVEAGVELTFGKGATTISNFKVD